MNGASVCNVITNGVFKPTIHRLHWLEGVQDSHQLR
jgi:hypothetical protein